MQTQPTPSSSDLIEGFELRVKSTHHSIPQVFLDDPLSTGSVVFDSMRIFGWLAPCESDSIHSLVLEKEGKFVGLVPYGYSRPDVATALKNPDVTDSGFCGLIPTSSIFPGKVELLVQFSNGRKESLFEIQGTPAEPIGRDKLFEEMTDSSQDGEVAGLRKYMRADWPQILVDVGAHDGVYLSNSQPFIRAGWRALLIEPMPKIFARLETVYSGFKSVTCLNIACSDKAGPALMFQGVDGELGQNSTLCTDENEWFAHHRTNHQVPVTVDTVTATLEKNHIPRDFSILLVDAEGMDYEVLKGLDTSRFSPRLILTEEYEVNAPKNNAKHELLRTYGYKKLETLGCNTLWGRQDLF